MRTAALGALLLAWGARPGPAAAALSAVWADSGDEKIAQEELRATTGSTSTLSRVWDGTTISVFGARNEVVSFDLILEARGGAEGVSVSLDRLDGPDGASIRSTPATGDGVFDWTARDLELFFVRYLPIRGVSRIANDPTYDERLVPYRLRRPWTLTLRGRAAGRGGWTDRPDHDRFYPEIAVPLELVASFKIPARRSQAVWADLYIPKSAPAGVFRGEATISEKGGKTRRIPVRLTVRDFTLPDEPSAKTMVYYSGQDINRRFLGATYAERGTALAERERRIKDRFFMLAHRHRVSLIGEADCGDAPCAEWVPRLDGSLFTAAHGYGGPGAGTGNGVFSIGTYGSWSWKDGGRERMWAHADAWASWFKARSPATEYFLYLIDESSDTARIERWASWISENPGVGRELRSLATIGLPKAAAAAPHLDIPASSLSLGDPAKWAPPAALYTDPNQPRKRFFLYNGGRPGSGSFMTEDDSVALRELAWGQYKKRIARWFYWNATYYRDYQGGGGDTPLFSRAQTFGGPARPDATMGFGQTSGAYGNGDGVLLYPGTDTVFPSQSYGVDGPFASLRLKAWRRGLQDYEYLTLAARRDPAAVDRIVAELVPKVLWEYGVENVKDPTYQYTDVSWPVTGGPWEDARERLAAIIERGPR